MAKKIIEAKNIGKKYVIAHRQGSYVSLRDVVASIFKSPFSYLKDKTKSIAGFSGKEDFWALSDINFEVEQGEVIGIIGKNGAGKSTLLKILSQITPPTTGEIKIYGRVGSLLEVGTGFHPELTGRENIFLNGAILGMGKKEIVRKFDDIVEFAGIGQFLDTPVKHYSSGMYVRLAFSVAAHMEPDILIIDEVLAVGDAEFQKKCLGKMDEITKKDGRTILFVSHNMGAIAELCKRCILLEKGKIVKTGPTEEVLNSYLKTVNENSVIPISERKDRTGSGMVRINDLKITNIEGNMAIRSFDDLKVTVKLNRSIGEKEHAQVILGFYDSQSRGLFRIDSDTTHKKTESGKDMFEFTTGKINIVPQLCTVNVALIINGTMSDYIINAYSFEIGEATKENIFNFTKELSTILIETEQK